MTRIIGLDLGTNSIGWSVVESDQTERIIASGSRIIPMDAATLGDFEKGNLQSAAAERRFCRGKRRLYERSKLRRERLLRVLNLMGFLPSHFTQAIDFAEHPGKFKDHAEPLLAYAMDADGRREFIFKEAFDEMIGDFREAQPDMMAEGRRIPQDWTIYYLRQKALREAVSKEELAWIILNFNAKRGYYQLGGEETDNGKREEYMQLTVSKVEQMDADKKRRGWFWYEITYDNGATQRKASPMPPRKVGDRVEVIVTTTLDKDGSIKKDKDGKDKISLRSPGADDWTLMKKRTEHAIEQSGMTVGEYIYANLLRQPGVKVRGKLIHTIERKYYRYELTRILNRQLEFIPELTDAGLYERCLRELYHHNEAHVASMMQKNFTDLFVEDIVFYQRPLKSKKSEIDDCPYEYRTYVDKQTGEITNVPLKCIVKSHPLFLEFRLWQWVKNLRIYKKGIGNDIDETDQLLPDDEARAALFDWLNLRKDISQDQLLRYEPFGLKRKTAGYRWNYVEDKTYPCNETAYEINRRLDKISSPRLADDDMLQLWHLMVSVTDPIQQAKALTTFASKRGIDAEAFAEAFRSYAPERSSYGAYSEKAIKKLLALMRMGSHWKPENIDARTMERINHIIDGETDESIAEKTRERATAMGLDEIGKFSGLPLHMACYIVYDRHSETSDLTRWEKPEDIDTYLRTSLKHGSLRNPVVEKVVVETLKVVRDLWQTYGKIDEVHIEMGRDLKNNAEKRKADTERINNNEKTNMRIRRLLMEFEKPEYGIEGVRPNSPRQMETLKIYEEGALNSTSDRPDYVEDVLKNLSTTSGSSKVTENEIRRYALWLEQHYQSPYTGAIIPLSRLFTSEYEIEHVIPRSRYFDDSLSNKVICESEVNKDKGNMLAMEYISSKGGSIIKVFHNGISRDVRVFKKEQYEDFVAKTYASNKAKTRKLMMEDIPDAFIERQLNDSRYMSRKMQEILSMLVREEGEVEATSKRVLSTNGSITDVLKAHWGLKDVWSQLIAPRFIRLNAMTESKQFGQWREVDGQRWFQTDVPIDLRQGFNPKRIDHRHHAMDAIVIAFTTRNHINFINNQAALSRNQTGREDLRRKLCYKRKTNQDGSYEWVFKKPYDNFTIDAKRALEGIIVSFKQNLRVISKTANFYTHYDEEGKKVVSRQTKGDGWAIRKSLHKATFSGLVRLREKKPMKLKEALEQWDNICDKDIKKGIKEVMDLYKGRADTKTLVKYFKDRAYKLADGKDIAKIDVWQWTEGKDAMTATRVSIDESFDDKTIAKITDSGIRKILTAHLRRYDDEKGNAHPEAAFSPEGLATMNRDIQQLNGGKPHKPIFKARKMETKGMKFAVGEAGTKGKKFVEADKGTNLFFAIYQNASGERAFECIPFNVAVSRMKQGLSVAKETNDKAMNLLFTLSPGDLVYVPKEAETESPETLDRSRIYKMVSTSEQRCEFVPASMANPIFSGFEFQAHNKMEKTIDDGVMIKRCCLKLIVDRLGRITDIIGREGAS